MTSEAHFDRLALMRLLLTGGTSVMQFWKVEKFSGIVGRSVGQENLIVRNLKMVVSIWNAIRNTSSLPSGGGRQCRKQRFEVVDAEEKSAVYSSCMV